MCVCVCVCVCGHFYDVIHAVILVTAKHLDLPFLSVQCDSLIVHTCWVAMVAGACD